MGRRSSSLNSTWEPASLRRVIRVVISSVWAMPDATIDTGNRGFMDALRT